VTNSSDEMLKENLNMSCDLNTLLKMRVKIKSDRYFEF